MRLPALFAALALSAALPTVALAQTPAPAAPSASGVTMSETKDWLVGLGGSVIGPETVNGRTVLRVRESLPWTLSFYACSTVCDDAQFEAWFNGPVTEAQLTAWNRDNRFAKAIWIAPTTVGGDARVILQYDLLLTETGVDQLQEPTVIWLQQLRAFVRLLFGEVTSGLVIDMSGEGFRQPPSTSPER